MMKKIYILLFIVTSGVASLKAQLLMQDLRPGMDGSEPYAENTVMYNDLLFFIANDGDGTTSKLFSTDATNITRISGSQTFTIYALLGIYNNELYFWGYDYNSAEGTALYKTNMQPDQEELVYDPDPVNTFSFYTLTPNIVFNNILYFLAGNDAEGFEIWRTDGTSGGTYILKDIEPGSGSSVAFTNTKGYFGILNNLLYFCAGNSTFGSELWRTDGTEAGTEMVKDIETDNSFGIPQYGSNPAFFTYMNNKLYFSANTTAQGRELWTTDGTENGTVMVKDIASGSSSPTMLTVYNNKLYFNAYDNNQGYSLFTSDGTNAGTNVVKSISNGGPESPEWITIYDNRLFFKGSDNVNYAELWSSDGSSVGTAITINLNGSNESHPRGLLATTNYLYYQAYNSNGEYLIYRTAAPVTSASLISVNTNVLAQEPEMFLINGCLLFVGDDGNTGKEFYKICNQNTQAIGIEEFNTHPVCLIYPNPANEEFYISSIDLAAGDITLQIMDMSGKTVQTSYIGDISEGDKYPVSITGIAQGFYSIILRSNGKPVYHAKLSVVK